MQPGSSIQAVFENQADDDVIRFQSVWEWTGKQFEIAESVEPGNGYWVYLAGENVAEVNLLGTPPTDKVYLAQKGWNLVGTKDILPVARPANPEIIGQILVGIVRTNNRFQLTTRHYLKLRDSSCYPARRTGFTQQLTMLH